MKRVGKFLVALCCALFLASAASAQLDRSALTGTVMDSSGRVLPGVHITAVKKDTGLRRESVSTASGAYDLPALPVGVYTVTFSLAGFEELSFVDVVQTIGHTSTLNATLKVSAQSERVEVHASALELNENSAALGARTEHTQLEDLPLNGRNWASLSGLAPGAMDTGGSNQRTIHFAGRSVDDNNYTFDGVDATNIINQAQQPFVRLAMPTDTIQEFRVESALFTAETGNSPGGQLAVTSVSGSNDFHGDVFDFFRNNVLDARNYFDTEATQPPFRLNQFGASLGGPVVRNRTFFFASYEGLRQSLGQTLIGFVPTDSFRTDVETQSPALTPILNAYPEGQTQVTSQVAEFQGEANQLDNENAGMVRLDQHFSDKTTAFVRFSVDEAITNAPFAGNSGQYLNDRQEVGSRPVNGVIELLHVFSPTLVNEAKFGFNRSTVSTFNLGLNQLPYTVAIPGFTTENSNLHNVQVGNTFSEIDNLTWVKGRHILKVGAEVRRIQLNEGNTASGSISYASLAAFEANQVNSASYAAQLPVNGLRKYSYFGFIQDEFKVRPNFTLNVGLRYQFYDIFHEVLGRANPFDFFTCGPQGFCGVGASFGKPNYADLDPRFAFAWAPAMLGGKTVIRGGAGIYHGDGQLDDQDFPVSNEVQRYSLSSKSTPGLAFPIDPFLANTTGIISPKDEDRYRNDMYMSQWGLSVQQSLPGSFIAAVSYIGDEGTHLLDRNYVNVIDPTTGARPYPAFGQIEFRGNGNDSSFNALQASLRRSFRSGFLFSANYMWAHELDNGSAGAGGRYAHFPQNVACPISCEWASGDFDARHTFNADAVYQLPFGAGRTYLSDPGVLRAMFGSWDFDSVVTARTGLPVNVSVDRSSSALPDGNANNQRPDIVPGVSLTPSGGASVTEWINPAAFAVPAAGTWGDAPRNVARGPGAWQTDIGLAKRFDVNERLDFRFRMEVFNLFNHPTFGAPQADISAGPGNFGVITSTLNTGPVGTGTPRQLQLMLRMEF